MGQWDPPFNCNAHTYLYCCGTCGYRFCCEFAHDRLDQSTCTNYDTPNWVNTGKPPVKVDEPVEGPTKDKTNMIVYIICGVVAIMVLVGIFTKLGLEKARRPRTEMNMSRALTDLLKQQSHHSVDYIEHGGNFGSVQVPIADSLTPRTTRSSVEQPSSAGVPASVKPPPVVDVARCQPGQISYPEIPLRAACGPLDSKRAPVRQQEKQPHLNNALAPSRSVSQMGPTHPHNNILQRMGSAPPPGQDFNKYATLQAVAETAPDDFYSKRYPLRELTPSGVTFPALGPPQKDRPPGELCGGFVTTTPTQKTKVSKSNAQPLFNPGYKGWEQSEPPGRRLLSTNRRQYNIEHLPEIFNVPPHYKQQRQRHLSTNSKTEVTV
ncbi:protein shisa-9-like [Hemiscyllium ocellatum]|uniref:protein shisa-9-like n=1 Tax=Hemiscyllium ocellatum TaxID=170820 RepID=UPI002966412D|nr:protein shisa-9-like [Hemiscyllium ocellatum]